MGENASSKDCLNSKSFKSNGDLDFSSFFTLVLDFDLDIFFFSSSGEEDMCMGGGRGPEYDTRIGSAFSATWIDVEGDTDTGDCNIRHKIWNQNFEISILCFDVRCSHRSSPDTDRQSDTCKKSVISMHSCTCVWVIVLYCKVWS